MSDETSSLCHKKCFLTAKVECMFFCKMLPIFLFRIRVHVVACTSTSMVHIRVHVVASTSTCMVHIRVHVVASTSTSMVHIRRTSLFYKQTTDS